MGQEWKHHSVYSDTWTIKENSYVKFKLKVYPQIKFLSSKMSVDQIHELDAFVDDTIKGIRGKGVLKVMSISANIGCGKSTLLEAYSKAHENVYIITESISSIQINSDIVVLLIPEPIREWTNTGALDLLYSDKDAYAKFFNTMSIGHFFKSMALVRKFKEMVERHKDANVSILVITERSILDTCFVFGAIGDEVTKQYLDHMGNCALVSCLAPDIFVQLKRPVKDMLSNIHDRARGKEISIDLSYLLKLQKREDDMMNTLKDKGYPVKIINTDNRDKFKSSTESLKKSM